MSDFSWTKEMKEKLQRREFEDPQLREAIGAGPVASVQFDAYTCEYYLGEVGVKNHDLIYHFFPKPEGWPVSEQSQKSFADVMGDAFIEVFRFEDKIQAAYSDELKSWAVKVMGYGDNLAVDVLKTRLFDVLNRRLKL